MATKVAIMEQIGERGLLLPELISRGLTANDRLKYYLTLLQAAHAHARAPGLAVPDLHEEREATGIDDPSLDHVIETSSNLGNETLQIPFAGTIIQHLFDELRVMAEPVRVAAVTRPDVHARFEVYQRRLDDLVGHAPASHDGQLSTKAVSTLTELSTNGHDTVHRLAVDLHWELNRLQGSVPVDTVDGASVYGITDTDRLLVRSFMTGVNQTARLKFDHPGLGTTAARDGDRLSIQNDLGATNAHVVVMQITGLLLTLTYTDVHRARTAFLHDLLRPLNLKWSVPSVSGADYYISMGEYQAGNLADLERCLMFIGSRLVFLIDWSRARKRLARLVRKSDASDLLRWAADRNIGHRAFLELGDVRLIEAAVSRAVPLQARPGAMLGEWLGREPARLLLMSALRAASAGLLAGRSASFVEDEIEAELVRHLESADRHSLTHAVEQAAMISALAERVARTMMVVMGGPARIETARTAELTGAWAARAGQMAAQSLRAVDHTPPDHQLERLVNEAGTGAEALEQSASMLAFLQASIDATVLSQLAGLSNLLVRSVREYVRCLEHGRSLSPSSPRPDVDDFLTAVDRLPALDRQMAAAERALTERLLRGTGDFRDLYVVANIARGFARAGSSLARCGAIVHDRVLNARPSL